MSEITIYEMGPRDGLQNEKKFLSVEERVEFAQKLSFTGLKHIELGSFVSPKWVPQMKGSQEVINQILQKQKSGKLSSDIEFLALVPNSRGLEEALTTELGEVAIFGAASESFSRANINCSIAESLDRFRAICSDALAKNIKVRGYISTVFGCPFEGPVDHKRVGDLVEAYLSMGVYQVSLGDTVGVASPIQVRQLLTLLRKRNVDFSKLALHFHDTRGTGMANVLASIDLGIRIFDSSLGGLGGCPYAPAATGNIATEDLVYMCEEMGLSTGIDFEELIKVNRWMSGIMQRDLPSRAGRAGRLIAKPLALRESK